MKKDVLNGVIAFVIFALFVAMVNFFVNVGVAESTRNKQSDDKFDNSLAIIKDKLFVTPVVGNKYYFAFSPKEGDYIVAVSTVTEINDSTIQTNSTLIDSKKIFYSSSLTFPRKEFESNFKELKKHE